MGSKITHFRTYKAMLAQFSNKYIFNNDLFHALYLIHQVPLYFEKRPMFNSLGICCQTVFILLKETVNNAMTQNSVTKTEGRSGTFDPYQSTHS